MANYSLRMNFSKLFFEHLCIGGARRYHAESSKFPEVPLPIHDSDYQLFPEVGQPYNLFVPDFSQVNYDDLVKKAIIKINDTNAKFQRILKQTSEISLFQIRITSNQAMQTARDLPNKIFKNNYFISNEGTVAVEKILRLEKLTTSAKEKLSEISSKIPDTRDIAPQVLKAWEDVKQKLPIWQKSIANKLGTFQNTLNKKIGTSKKEES